MNVLLKIVASVNRSSLSPYREEYFHVTYPVLVSIICRWSYVDILSVYVYIVLVLVWYL